MENYNLGGQGIAYNDSDPFINQGNQYGNNYRINEGVDLQPTADAGGGYNIGWSVNGEWTKYFIEISQSGYYKITTRVASPNSSGAFRIEIDGIDKTGNINVPLTGDWQNWTYVVCDNIYMEQGVHMLSYHIVNSGFNINKIIFSFSTTDIKDDSYSPEYFRLYDNYPNPFNSSTKIKFYLPHNSAVELKIYNVLGQLITTIIKEEKPSGFYEVDYNATDLPSGMYIYRIQLGEYSETKKMVLLR